METTGSVLVGTIEESNTTDFLSPIAANEDSSNPTVSWNKQLDWTRSIRAIVGGSIGGNTVLLYDVGWSQ